MNAIDYALNYVRREIPEEILKEAFRPIRTSTSRNRFNSFSSIDHQIRDKVIDGVVNVDCNLIGGSTVKIDLDTADVEDLGNNQYLIRLDDSELGGNELTHPIRIHMITGAQYDRIGPIPNQGMGAADLIMRAAGQIFKNLRGIASVSASNIQMVSKNTLLVNDSNLDSWGKMILVGMCSNNTDMSNLEPSSYRQYGEMVSLATKAHIYNTLNIKIGSDMMKGGTRIGQFAEVVRGWADARQMYKEYFEETWMRTSFNNDRVRVNELIGMRFSR